MNPVLCTIFFLSGAAALIFEQLWFRQAGLALGNSIWASSLVLAGFMGGLAIGNGVVARVGHHVRRPVALYAGIELAIAATGISLVHLLPMLSPLLSPILRPVLDVPLAVNAIRLGSAFLLLLVPSAAMGATLPLLVAALHRRQGQFGRALGLLYGWNTLGAVVGVVIGEVVLIDQLGIRATAWVAGGVNLVAAGLAWRVSRRLDAAGESAIGAPADPIPRRAFWFLAAAFVAGGSLLGLEVVWFRFLVLFVHGTSLTFAVMLSVVLLGIGLGGLIGSRWLAFRQEAHRNALGLVLLCGAVVVATYAGFTHVLAASPPKNEFGFAAFYYALPLMLPVAILSGMIFTLLGEAFENAAPAETRSAGLLTLANTAGAMLGPLVVAFGLLPSFGIERSIQLLAAGYGLAGLSVWFAAELPPGRRTRVLALACAGLFVVAMFTFPAGRMKDDYLEYPLANVPGKKNFEVVDIREGLTETIIYLKRMLHGSPLFYRMQTNNFGMSGTSTMAQRYMKLFVYLPIALRPAPRDALLISYGVGMTAKSLTETSSLERIDVVDISRDILEMNRIVYPDPSEYPLEDPRVTVHIEDGRHFLQTTDRRYDLITGEPPPPRIAGVMSLFTRQFFELAYDRLNPDGLISYWLPVHDLTVDERDAIISAFCEVFEDCTLWSGAKYDWILLGTRGELPQVDEAGFRRQWQDPVVSIRLQEIGVEVPEQLGALFMVDTPELQVIRRNTRPLDDDRPGQLGQEMVGVGQVGPGHKPLLKIEEGRKAFSRSEFIRRHWPPRVREETDAWFSYRRYAHKRFFGDKSSMLRRIPKLHQLLTETPLRTNLLWLLGTSKDEVECSRTAREAGSFDPRIEMALAIDALADRRFEDAAEQFGTARQGARALREALYLQIFALEMAGQHEQAKALASKYLRPMHSESEAQYIDFLDLTFGRG
ncbi:MAG: spermidine synthase [bacterium]|nr:spermidine synthase [bacterium]